LDHIVKNMGSCHHTHAKVRRHRAAEEGKAANEFFDKGDVLEEGR
jgi:tetratricopeptide (TPR) repeat protein